MYEDVVSLAQDYEIILRKEWNAEFLYTIRFLADGRLTLSYHVKCTYGRKRKAETGGFCSIGSVTSAKKHLERIYFDYIGAYRRRGYYQVLDRKKLEETERPRLHLLQTHKVFPWLFTNSDGTYRDTI